MSYLVQADRDMDRNTRDYWHGQTLFAFGDGELFTGRDAPEGLFIVGANGSGKSTGSGQTMLRSMVTAGYGGLVLTTKPDDLTFVVKCFEGTGRSPREDVVVLQPETVPLGIVWPEEELGPQRFYCLNLLQHEYEQGGKLISNVADVICAGITVEHSATANSEFFDRACRLLVIHAAELQVFGTMLEDGTSEIRLDDMLDIVATAPVSHADLSSKRFRDGRCYELLCKADERRESLREERFKDLKLTHRYFTLEYPSLAEETRSSIVFTLTGKLMELLRSPLRKQYCGETDDEVLPERAFYADPSTGTPKVIVVNLPVNLYHEVGRYAQVMFKTVWQHAAMRRTASILQEDPLWRPAFLFADEGQGFITRQDPVFQQMARSAMVSSVYLTQNLPNLYAAIGETATHSFLGNLQTKIFHAQGDPTTNEWGERVFGKSLQPFRSDPLGREGSSNESYSYSPVVPAIRFTELKKGGPSSDPALHGRVGAYVFQAGRQWRTQGPERHYHEFDQHLATSGDHHV
jgi:hypothetical protein